MQNKSSPTILVYLRNSAIPIITVTFGLQLLRVLLTSLVAYLRESVGVSSLDIAPIAFGIFALSFLAGIIWRFAGSRTALWITAGGVAIIRLVEQYFNSPQIDYYLSAVGVVLFLLYIPIGLALTRNDGETSSWNFGMAFILGIVVDTAIHTGVRSLDLSWQTGIVPILIIAVLAAYLLVSIGTTASQISTDNHREGHWSGTSALFALGPWILLQMFVFQNVSRVSALTTWETPAAGALVILGNALGLVFVVRLTHSKLSPILIASVSGLVLTLSMLAPELSGLSAAFQFIVSQILSLILAGILFAGFGKGSNTSGIARSTIANGIGNILFVLLAFLFYVSIDIPLGFRARMILPVLAIIITIGALMAARGDRQPMAISPNYQSPIFAGYLLLIPIILTFFWLSPVATEVSSENKVVRVMSYNLHNGANTDGRINLEALAQVIENSGADVVGLQEIARGWLIWGSPDMLIWLSQRLNMPYFYGPTEGAQWGNAILSRFPILNAENIPLEPNDLLLRRGYILATIDIGGGSIITVINTHFTQVDDYDAVRDEQSMQLIEAWDNAPATIILGDLNARPDENAIDILVNAGMIDVSAAIGIQPTYTYYSADPTHQIDYIFTSSDLMFSDFLIPSTTASDHLPLIVTVEIP